MQLLLYIYIYILYISRAVLTCAVRETRNERFSLRIATHNLHEKTSSRFVRCLSRTIKHVLSVCHVRERVFGRGNACLRAHPAAHPSILSSFPRQTLREKRVARLFGIMLVYCGTPVLPLPLVHPSSVAGGIRDCEERGENGLLAVSTIFSFSLYCALREPQHCCFSGERGGRASPTAIVKRETLDSNSHWKPPWTTNLD